MAKRVHKIGIHDALVRLLPSGARLGVNIDAIAFDYKIKESINQFNEEKTLKMGPTGNWIRRNCPSGIIGRRRIV